MKEKYYKFLEISKLLNKAFGIEPLLYGSLGLQILTGKDLNADDVDILVPEIFIKEKWENLTSFLESNGYEMIDLHEHTFEKEKVHFSFAKIESLESFANIKLDEIEVRFDNGTEFKLLSLKQYLQVYEASSNDSYRKRINKNIKDEKKIEFIKQNLDEKNERI